MAKSTLLSLTIVVIVYLSMNAYSQQQQVPLPESKTNAIAYPNVDTARKALLARKDTHSFVDQGWLIVIIPSEKTIWSFTPKTDAAYPAAVKRVVVERDGRVFDQLSVLCEASKAACDNLIRQFQQLDKKVSQDIKSHTN